MVEEAVPTERGLAAAETVSVGRPATFVVAGSTQVRGATVPGRRGPTPTFLLFFSNFLHAALGGIAVGTADDIVDTHTAVLKHIAHDVIGGHVGHAQGEIDVLTLRNGWTTGAGSGSVHALAENGWVAGGAAAAGAGVFGEVVRLGERNLLGFGGLFGVPRVPAGRRLP